MLTDCDGLDIPSFACDDADDGGAPTTATCTGGPDAYEGPWVLALDDGHTFANGTIYYPPPYAEHAGSRACAGMEEAGIPAHEAARWLDIAAELGAGAEADNDERPRSPRRVPGRPAGQRLADDPTPEARELLGLPARPTPITTEA